MYLFLRGWIYWQNLSRENSRIAQKTHELTGSVWVEHVSAPSFREMCHGTTRTSAIFWSRWEALRPSCCTSTSEIRAERLPGRILSIGTWTEDWWEWFKSPFSITDRFVKNVGRILCVFLDNKHIWQHTQWSGIVCSETLCSAQVERLEVVNKQFVRVILVPGADSSEAVSDDDLLYSSLCICGLALICTCLPSELRVV